MQEKNQNTEERHIKVHRPAYPGDIGMNPHMAVVICCPVNLLSYVP